MRKFILLLTCVASVASLKAADAPFFQASLTPDVAIYPKTTEIHGLSLSIWGENPHKGIALGLVNGSSGDSSGFTWGIFNYSESYTGVSWGWGNYNKVSFVGWQYGLVNIATGSFTGLQSGWIFNYAKELKGVQIGLVTYAQNLHGVQIGLVNIAKNNPWFDEFPDKLATGFPIVNWSF